LILSLLSGCSAPDDRKITLPLQAHSLASCPLPAPARLDLAALGDFPTSNRTSESLSVDAAGTKLAFPASMLALEATASAELASEPYIGFSERLADRFDFLLWPESTACDLFRPSSGDSFPGELGGEALGFSHSSGLVVLAGSNDANSAAIVGALTFDTRTGTSYVVDPGKRQVLSEPRAFATVTDFAGKVLVAGGENPIHEATLPASILRDSAEVYDPLRQGFEPDLVTLAEATSRQAAATLESGETVLLGGRDERSDASNVVQVVSPETRVCKLIDSLAVGRNSPVALRLSDGRILVGGGTDADGHPIGALESRAADASRQGARWDGSSSLPARYDRAFVALPGGAALAVGGCEDRNELPGEDCTAWCIHGCPPTPDPVTNQSYDAFWLAADGSIVPLDFPFSAPRPVLAQGSDGRPWLVASDVDQSNQPLPGTFALYRFDPWQKRFDPVDTDLGFDQSLSQARLVSTGPDAFVWFGADGHGPVMRGVRLGTRSAFTSDVPLVSLRDGSLRPAHLAPDHAPNGNVSYDADLGKLLFSALSPASTPVCVWISDAEYGDFSAQVAFSSTTPPALRLGSQLLSDPNSAGSSPTCQLPVVSANNTANSVSLHRKAGHLTLDIGAATASCELDVAIALARLPFGVCQSELGPAEVTQITVTRGD
jgi:hypothetical protein